MSNLQTWRPHSLLFALGVVLALIVIHLIPLQKGTQVTWDTELLVQPLTKIHNLTDYVQASWGGQLMDVQPLRDLSFKLDLWLSQWFGKVSFQITNLVIFGFFLHAAYRLFCLVLGRPRIARALILLYAIHPIFVSPAAWIAARKHLLSALFIVWATTLWIRGRKLWICVPLYFGALFSHPLPLLWPVWALLYTRAENPRSQWKTRFLTLASCLPVLVFAAWLNHRYYNVIYPRQTGIEKSLPLSFENAWVGVLSLGRYFINFAFPVQLSPTYSVASVWTKLGLPALGLFLWCAWRTVPKKDFVHWCLFAYFPLALVTLRMTHVFVNDPYFLTPSIGIQLLLGMMVMAHLKKHPSVLKVYKLPVLGTATLLIAALAIRSHQMAGIWVNDVSLWEFARASEKTPFALSKLAHASLKAAQFERARMMALELEALSPGHPDAPLLYSKAIYLDSQISAEQKLANLASHRWQDDWYAYYFSGSALLAGNLSLADQILRDTFMKGPTRFGSELSSIAAEAVAVCLRVHPQSQSNVCDSIVKGAKENHPSTFWDEQRFQNRLKSLLPARSNPKNP